MTKDNTGDEIITFLRQRDYKLVKELGQGACGKTVLLHDDQIDEHFVCKKYTPYSETSRQQLFANFVREVKLLHQVHHLNVVRVFNYYLYPQQFAGFILMEHVNGSDIDDYLAESPDRTSDLFLQAISGFSYLERCNILHRDIRPGNIMVRDDGVLKIIDLGFGKQINKSEDFGKSISLNWWCETPDDFKQERYDFRTEVYFVGKLFERIIQENDINHFKYREILAAMCQREPESRIASFADVEKAVGSDQFSEISFDKKELQAYREFSYAMCRHITKIESGTKYQTDVSKIRTQLNDAYRGFMLEETVPDSAVVLRCFIAGKYYYVKVGLTVSVVKNFLQLLKSLTDERIKIVLANLHTKLDSLPRYSESLDDDIPF